MMMSVVARAVSRNTGISVVRTIETGARFARYVNASSLVRWQLTQCADAVCVRRRVAAVSLPVLVEFCGVRGEIMVRTGQDAVSVTSPATSQNLNRPLTSSFCVNLTCACTSASLSARLKISLCLPSSPLLHHHAYTDKHQVIWPHAKRRRPQPLSLPWLCEPNQRG